MANGKSPRVASPRKQIAPKPNLVNEVKNDSSFDLETEIRRRAYQLYEMRGCIPGHEDEDWLVAEGEVKARFNLLASSARA
jgi:hypothetical protein